MLQRGYALLAQPDIKYQAHHAYLKNVQRDIIKTAQHVQYALPVTIVQVMKKATDAKANIIQIQMEHIHANIMIHIPAVQFLKSMDGYIVAKIVCGD